MIVMSRASFSSSSPSSPFSSSPSLSASPPPPPPPIPTNPTSRTQTPLHTHVHTHTHKHTPRQAQPTSGSGSESLSFGFAFMGLLLFLLFFAHMMQRVANRRQRDVLGRMAALQDTREVEEVPRVWDVRLEGVGRRREVSEDKGKREEEEDEVVGNGLRRTWVRKGERWKWKDVQPLSADPILLPPEETETDLQTLSSGPHDKLRPLRVAMIIAMPTPSSKPSSLSSSIPIPTPTPTPTTKNTSYSTNDDYRDETEDELPYIELGVTTIK